MRFTQHPAQESAVMRKRAGDSQQEVLRANNAAPTSPACGVCFVSVAPADPKAVTHPERGRVHGDCVRQIPAKSVMASQPVRLNEDPRAPEVARLSGRAAVDALFVGHPFVVR